MEEGVAAAAATRRRHCTRRSRQHRRGRSRRARGAALMAHDSAESAKRAAPCVQRRCGRRGAGKTRAPNALRVLSLRPNGAGRPLLLLAGVTGGSVHFQHAGRARGRSVSGDPQRLPRGPEPLHSISTGTHAAELAFAPLTGVRKPCLLEQKGGPRRGFGFARESRS